MSNAAPPRSAAALKSALESALIGLLVSGVCLWFLISGTQQGDGEIDPARATMLALGLAAGACAHLTFMCIALRRAGRSVVLWMLAMVCLPLVGSVVLGALLFTQAQEMDQQALAEGQDGAGRAT